MAGARIATHRGTFVEGGIVEKLESVLRAEDDARATVSEAHSRAENILKEAQTRSVTLRADTEAEARAQAATARAQAIDAARTQAAAIVADAEAAQSVTLSQAAVRVDAAVAAIMDELVG